MLSSCRGEGTQGRAFSCSLTSAPHQGRTGPGTRLLTPDLPAPSHCLHCFQCPASVGPLRLAPHPPLPRAGRTSQAASAHPLRSPSSAHLHARCSPPPRPPRGSCWGPSLLTALGVCTSQWTLNRGLSSRPST